MYVQCILIHAASMWSRFDIATSLQNVKYQHSSTTRIAARSQVADVANLVVYIELVCMTALHHQTKQVRITVHPHTLQLPSLVACALIAIKAKVPKTLHDALLWVCCASWQAANVNLNLGRDLMRARNL